LRTGACRPGELVEPGEPGVKGADAVWPAVQSLLFEEPAADTAVPVKLAASASGFPLVLASPAYTRTTMRFMLVKLVSK